MNSDPTRIGTSTNFDIEILSRIEVALERANVSVTELIELWPVFLRRVSFLKVAALFELFQQVKTLPGSVVECGVFRGQSLFLFRHLLDTYAPGDSLRKVIGFDTFTGFTSLHEHDGPPDQTRAKVEGGWDSSSFLPTLQEAVSIAKDDGSMPRVARVELIEGDVLDTIPDYVVRNPGLRISLLNLDLDLYEPTLVALEYLYPLVVPGGLVIVDEYAMPGFPGESRALEEYFGGKIPPLTKFPFTPTPGAYFRKGM